RDLPAGWPGELRLLLGERTKTSRRGGTPAATRNRFVGLQPLTEYRRSPSSALVDVTASPIFLPRAPDINPRTECACQSVAFMSSFRVAPPERFSRSRTLEVLLPWRAPVAFSWATWPTSRPCWPSCPTWPGTAQRGPSVPRTAAFWWAVAARPGHRVGGGEKGYQNGGEVAP